MLTARAGKEKGGEQSPLFSYVQEQVVFNGLFHFPLLDADITLCDGGGAVLEKVLDEDNVIIVCPVDLRCVPFTERMGADAVIAEPATDFAKVLLYLRGGERDDDSVRADLMVDAIDAQELMERKRNGEGSGFSGFLLRDGQAVSFPVLNNIGKTQLDNVGHTDSEVPFQHERQRHSLIRAAASEAVLCGLDDLFVLLRRERNGAFVHGVSVLSLAAK